MRVIIRTKDGESVEFEQLENSVYMYVDFANKDDGKDATKEEKHEHTIIVDASELSKALKAIKG